MMDTDTQVNGRTHGVVEAVGAAVAGMRWALDHLGECGEPATVARVAIEEGKRHSWTGEEVWEFGHNAAMVHFAMRNCIERYTDRNE